MGLYELSKSSGGLGTILYGNLHFLSIGLGLDFNLRCDCPASSRNLSILVGAQEAACADDAYAGSSIVE